MFIQTDFPDPVAPAINICGILLRSPTIHFPVISFPKAKAKFLLVFVNSLESRTSLKKTGNCFLFGTSIPIAAFPGIGASILTPFAANPNAISSCKLTIFDTFTPGLGCNSNLVTEGPLVTCITLASTPKSESVSTSLSALSIKSFLSSFFNFNLEFMFSKFIVGNKYSFLFSCSTSFIEYSISLLKNSLSLKDKFLLFVFKLLLILLSISSKLIF